MPTIIDDVKRGFNEYFHYENNKIMSCGGRFEILGNHTDHNHGLCLAATCDLAIYGALNKRDDMMVNFVSQGYCPFKVDLNELEIRENELNTSAGLVRGVARYLKDAGYEIGGFDIYTISTIFPGAGVSSSAAFELLVAEIFNNLFNNDKIERILLCKAGQYSENNYFGKKSGLLDQIGVGFGNLVSIDFKDIKNPDVKEIVLPFDDLHFVIVNTGGSHAELSDLYSEIPSDMKNAAKVLGHEFLREGSLEELEAHKKELSQREYLRASHFYHENERVRKAIEAIKNNDEKGFLNCINGSRISSTNDLRNMMVGTEYDGSPLEACDIAMKAMNNEGAVKINGGGFAGSVISFVPSKYLDNYLKIMSEKYGNNNVKEVKIRKTGPSVE